MASNVMTWFYRNISLSGKTFLISLNSLPYNSPGIIFTPQSFCISAYSISCLLLWLSSIKSLPCNSVTRLTFAKLLKGNFPCLALADAIGPSRTFFCFVSSVSTSVEQRVCKLYVCCFYCSYWAKIITSFLLSSLRLCAGVICMKEMQLFYNLAHI